MNAAIIAVGSEMLTSDRVDTNSIYLAGELNKLGVEVVFKSIVGDNRDLLTAAVRDALERVPLLILTGGLGPTEDDLTRESVAAALHRRLLFEQSICDTIEALFARRGWKMAENNRRQAFLIDGAQMLENPNGTAPGQWLDLSDGMLVLLPGPPREMKPMFENLCLPRLIERLPESHIRTRFYRVAGLGESDLDARIAPIYKRYDNPVTTVLAAEGDVQVHLRARAASDAAAEALAEEVGAPILAALGRHVYSTNGDPLEAVIGKLLSAQGATLALAESCTAGLLGGRITEVAGSSRWFVGGFQVYSDEMKVRLLGLDPALLAAQGAVSTEVAQAMAVAAREKTGATYAIAVTGEAGPDPADARVAPGTVVFGIATPEHVIAIERHFPRGRQKVRAFAVQTALTLLRLELL